MEKALQLPIIDLASSDRISTANSIRKACLDCGFFYLINYGVEDDLLKRTFNESKRFFMLPLEEKMKLIRKHNRGYTPLYAEKLNADLNSKGDCKETFYVGPLESISSDYNLNQWPSEELLPSWRPTMECYYEKVLNAGKRLISLVALALNLDEDFFVKAGAFDPPFPFLRLLHYPGDLSSSEEEIFGSSAHSDYGMMTLLATDGVGGLQLCRDKSKAPLIWEDVLHIDGALVVNIGDMLERWTNCLFREMIGKQEIFLQIVTKAWVAKYRLLIANWGARQCIPICNGRSTLHRVMPVGRERYSMAFFLDPNPDCVVECLKSCCSESNPPRFPPVRSGDYLEERFRFTYI